MPTVAWIYFNEETDGIKINLEELYDVDDLVSAYFQELHEIRVRVTVFLKCNDHWEKINPKMTIKEVLEQTSNDIPEIKLTPNQVTTQPAGMVILYCYCY